MSAYADLGSHELVLSMISSSSCMHVDLVKLDYLLIHLPLFTLISVKSSYCDDPLFTLQGYFIERTLISLCSHWALIYFDVFRSLHVLLYILFIN